MMNFKRVKEDFECENCGHKTKGDGYTDHCPKCLWGKHVDEKIPGDRLSKCRGLMEPTKTEFQISNFQFLIKYKCMKCRHEFLVRSGDNDNKEKLMELTKY